MWDSLLATNTVDGRNPAITSWYGKYPIIFMVLYIPGGAEFLRSRVLAGGFNPSENICQIGQFPQIGVKI